VTRRRGEKDQNKDQNREAVIGDLRFFIYQILRKKWKEKNKA